MLLSAVAKVLCHGQERIELLFAVLKVSPNLGGLKWPSMMLGMAGKDFLLLCKLEYII